MTREEYLNVAVQLLNTVYQKDIKAVANIINAHAEVLEGNEEGYQTILEALGGVRDFVNELIENLGKDESE